ncbi:MAG TPA: orotidine-5'-phosphate decarboxylase [Chromatiaceae bacterium]|nr:orotidine-5'-phosphate decarboxylase [Chromatiaceae bacterium]
MKVASPLVVALDFPTEEAALALLERLDPALCRVKIGKELFTRAGPRLVERVVARGFEVFLDLKYHDIPNTVAAACDAAADLGVWMMNLHASGGRRMMEAAAERLACRDTRPLLIAVTILTSLGAEDLAEIGFHGSPAENVSRLARLSRDAGLDGVVCSPLEAAMLRADLGADFRLITPGVRPGGAAVGDQKRVMTPRDALAAGASYLVIGRPITAAPEPLDALRAILDSLPD